MVTHFKMSKNDPTGLIVRILYRSLSPRMVEKEGQACIKKLLLHIGHHHFYSLLKQCFLEHIAWSPCVVASIDSQEPIKTAEAVAK